MAWAPYAIMALSAADKLSSAKTQEDNAIAERDRLRYDQQVAENNATATLQVANANEDAQRRKSAQQLGSQRASLAESGISLTSGTGADLTHDSAVNAEMDALSIRYGGVTQAIAYRNQASSLGLSASVADSNARSAGIRGPLSAGAAALSAYGAYKGATTRTK